MKGWAATIIQRIKRFIIGILKGILPIVNQDFRAFYTSMR